VVTVSWTRTSEWWRAVREVSDELEHTGLGMLPWRPHYAEVFGDREGLLAALRYRWQLIAQAQGSDPAWSVGERLLHDDDLAARHAGLLRAIGAAEREPAVA
jgi:hypothetical protein